MGSDAGTGAIISTVGRVAVELGGSAQRRIMKRFGSYQYFLFNLGFGFFQNSIWSSVLSVEKVVVRGFAVRFGFPLAVPPLYVYLYPQVGFCLLKQI